MKRYFLFCIILIIFLCSGCVTHPSDSNTTNTDDPYKTTAKIVTPCAILFIKKDSPPCDQLKPIFDELAEDYNEKVEFSIVDCNVEPDLAADYDVLYVPTIVIIDKYGDVIHQIVGFKEKDDIKELIDSKLKFVTPTNRIDKR